MMFTMRVLIFMLKYNFYVSVVYDQLSQHYKLLVYIYDKGTILSLMESNYQVSIYSKWPSLTIILRPSSLDIIQAQ